MLTDILIGLIWLGGAKMAYVDYKWAWVQSMVWPYYLGRHLAFYALAYKTLASSFQEELQKRKMN